MKSDVAFPQAKDRVLSTLERDGSRRWLYPRLSKGRFWVRRRVVAYVLLALFTLVPFLRIGGKPVILLDLARRHFTLLGVTFLPTDTALLALLLLTVLLSMFKPTIQPGLISIARAIDGLRGLISSGEAAMCARRGVRTAAASNCKRDGSRRLRARRISTSARLALRVTKACPKRVYRTVLSLEDLVCDAGREATAILGAT